MILNRKKVPFIPFIDIDYIVIDYDDDIFIREEEEENIFFIYITF